MSSNSDSTPDTYRKVLNPTTKVDNLSETLDGTGVSDTEKASNMDGVVIANKTFIGAPSENDIDVVRGTNLTIGPNTHLSTPGVCQITAKGGIDGILVKGKFGTIELGQFSIYDKWFALPPTRNVVFAADAEGTAILWNCKYPVLEGNGVKVKVIPPYVWRPYFLYRSTTRQLYEWVQSVVALLKKP